MEGVIKARADQLGIPYEEMEQEYLQKISLRRMVNRGRCRGYDPISRFSDGAECVWAIHWRMRQR